MFRFSIRDVLWLTVVVGLAVGWWIEHCEISRLAIARTRELSSIKERLSVTERVKDENMVKYHFLWLMLDEDQKAEFSKRIGRQGFVSKANQPTPQSP